MIEEAFTRKGCGCLVVQELLEILTVAAVVFCIPFIVTRIGKAMNIE
jgi:hypothetical protein